jgi:preprotein translocase subunit SecB
VKRPVSATIVREISWERLNCPRLSKKQPTVDDVESLVNSLTESDPGTVILTVGNRNTLTVKGDSTQGFLVSISSASKQLYALAEPEQQRGMAVLFIGSQREVFPRRLLVDRVTAVKAARGFHQRGLADESVNWTADFKSVR